MILIRLYAGLEDDPYPFWRSNAAVPRVGEYVERVGIKGKLKVIEVVHVINDPDIAGDIVDVYTEELE